ncbi:MAG: formylglycine-generating enzyme family protein, partial [Elusimicrobiales bacterium]|nr:formylglycine-generating enzyme family protein [Elusimicrobiales bacterium]
ARKAREAERVQKAREAEQARKEREEREKKEREQAELQRREVELTQLDGEIAAMQRRIESGGSSAGDSLKKLAALVESRGELAEKIAAKRRAQAAALAEQQRQRAEIERRRREELARAEAEKERLRQVQLAAAEAKRRSAVEADIADYEKIVNSSGGSSLAGAAWTGLVGKYPSAAGIEPGDLATFRQVVIEGISLAELRERERAAAAAAAAAEARRLAEMAGELVDVPGGCYRMGANDGDSDERPVHEVCVDGFAIGKYEVTQGQWQRIMGNNPSSFKKGDNYPVERVSWNDAQEYLRKLNAKT